MEGYNWFFKPVCLDSSEINHCYIAPISQCNRHAGTLIYWWNIASCTSFCLIFLSLSGFFLPNALCILQAALLSRQFPGMLPSSICFASLAESSALSFYLNLFLGIITFQFSITNLPFFIQQCKKTVLGVCNDFKRIRVTGFTKIQIGLKRITQTT